jgi:hypothetical protein
MVTQPILEGPLPPPRVCRDTRFKPRRARRSSTGGFLNAERDGLMERDGLTEREGFSRATVLLKELA